MLGIFPPHIECVSTKIKNNDDVAAIIGTGNLKSINLKKKNVVIGNDNIPKIVINLKEICNGII